MCGRYYLADFSEEEMMEYIKILAELDRLMSASSDGIHYKAKGEIFPSDTVPVIANNRKLQTKAFAMKWGYNLSNGNTIINARSETASIKPIFRDGMLRRRCLIPASYYFEWEKQNKKKIKHAIRPAGQRAMLMAGIYRIENEKPVFAILTRDIAPEIAFIHNRMPVILPAKSQKDWLNIDNNADEVIQSAIKVMEHRLA